ncbi:hypothetical protein Cpa01nite_07290 [Cellulomonas pakistanensis]|uniref:Lipoprotein n=1 Tax=Cellulomonas pakistanensis TaxID=992287 RepID=A0A919U1W2_9CELL|nr:hypothetical protein Cpa01nite_07290 [Cellulomonas pakistanensis]
MKRVGMTATLASAVAIALVGCGTASSRNASVPDDVLFAQVTALPGVRDADLKWELNFGNTPAYMGTVVAEADADPLCVLDETLAVLYQGRRDTSLRAVEVVQGSTSVRAEDLVGETPLGERYGPRPARPQPSASPRPCTPPSLDQPTGGATAASTPGRTP